MTPRNVDAFEDPPMRRWRWMSERGLKLTTGDETLILYNLLISMNFDEIDDVIPADGSLLVIFRRGMRASPELWAVLGAPLSDPRPLPGELHKVAAEFGGQFGPDLADLALQAGMSETRYIEAYCACAFKVLFIGFQPGFPYLAGLPLALHAQRRATPRVRIEAGSVAVGGAYTGVYPDAGPGGWHVIGRTEMRLFDPQRDPPASLLPGDRVRFIAK